MKKYVAVLGLLVAGLAGCSSDDDGAATTTSAAKAPSMNDLLGKLNCTKTDVKKTLAYANESRGCEIGMSLQILVQTYDDNKKRDLGAKYMDENGGPNMICSQGEKWLACTTSGDDKDLEPLGGELI